MLACVRVCVTLPLLPGDRCQAVYMCGAGGPGGQVGRQRLCEGERPGSAVAGSE